ncbi:hypothetical protein QAD02_006812 [Eretmocerus hayati]|uniref:Uncharacterized protein n=1 Tax=Eretmocerus hayati TaxID=131215 RepID=A0ACC2N1Z1_9HYME|nr:hypothetical protein QAD02_006812 [Eretmocerus hayati]
MDECYHGNDLIPAEECHRLCGLAFKGIPEDSKFGFCRKGYCYCQAYQRYDHLHQPIILRYKLDELDKENEKNRERKNRKLNKKANKRGYRILLTEDQEYSCTHSEPRHDREITDQPSCSYWQSKDSEASQ